MQFLIDTKTAVSDLSTIRCDIFVSAYNDSERVQSVFAGISTPDKQWWVLPEYGYQAHELDHLDMPTVLTGQFESDILVPAVAALVERIGSGRLCIDLTGFMRSHILFLLKYLRDAGVTSFDTIYTEPSHYSKKADTTFSVGSSAVRTVDGFGGSHQPDQINDILILGVGYDDSLMAQVILNKDNARLVQLHSLPSLSADMYHESLLRLDRVSAVPARVMDDEVYFCSANDPYVIADTLSQAVVQLRGRRPITNLYLSPLATKVQALGFGLYYLRNLENDTASVILPVIDSYSRETSTGIGRTWLYPIHLA